LFIVRALLFVVFECTTARTLFASVANLALPWDLWSCYRSAVATAPLPTLSPRAGIVFSISSHQVRMLRKIQK